MNKRLVVQCLSGATALAAVLLLTIGLLLQPALAAPRMQEPELTIVKTAEGGGTIAPGQVVRFHITVINTGPGTATNVVVQDDYDQMAMPTIKILSTGAETWSEYVQDEDVITWQLGDLEPDAEWLASYEATAAEAFEPGTTEVYNVASAQGDNVWEVAQATVVLAVVAPQLALTRQWEQVDGERGIVPGDTVRYMIGYSNNGVAGATNVVLVDTFDETVVQQVDNITGDGQRPDAATVRWNLGTLAAGTTGLVSYEVTLKPVLSPDTKVYSLATIYADNAQPVSASDLFIPLTPRLSIERKWVDLNGGAIEPGDTLRFTISFHNSGAVAASDVAVQDHFNEWVVSEVTDISDGGGGVDGVVEWLLKEPLEPDAQRTVFYKVRLESRIHGPTEVTNTAIIFIRDVEVERALTTMTIEMGPVIGMTDILIILAILGPGFLLIVSISWIIRERRKQETPLPERAQATWQTAERTPTVGLTTGPRLAGRFADVEQQVEVLRQQVADGLLTEKECKARMRDLMVEDADGNWWMVGHETGEWYRHDGTGWVRADPPVASSDERSTGGA